MLHLQIMCTIVRKVCKPNNRADGHEQEPHLLFNTGEIGSIFNKGLAIVRVAPRMDFALLISHSGTRRFYWVMRDSRDYRVPASLGLAPAGLGRRAHNSSPCWMVPQTSLHCRRERRAVLQTSEILTTSSVQVKSYVAPPPPAPACTF